MSNKKQTCPHCGSKNASIRTSTEGTNPKHTKIKLGLCLFFTLTPLPSFITNLIKKSIIFPELTFWIALATFAIPLGFSIFYFIKYLKTRNYSPMEFLFCENCGYFNSITPIEHNITQD